LFEKYENPTGVGEQAEIADALQNFSTLEMVIGINNFSDDVVRLCLDKLLTTLIDFAR
jgi:hypothetical protein